MTVGGGFGGEYTNGAIASTLRRLGMKGVEIRKPEQLQSISSLIIPGGESTTMAKLAEFHNLFPALREFVQMGKPVWGTCAGLIFLANKAVGQKEGGQELVGGLNCTVHRNYFGSQVITYAFSFTTYDAYKVSRVLYCIVVIE
ncbi:putative pyridoxal 5'-phosphate synthase subunit PDX2 [Gossypium australe]|uniref:glutaminase n=1 Tax=Gossypium australe TaxID=47621 RepID=A0A5B6X7B5_9ROSI|nr:putative pyridoxal 5'-phosphate synthase subunit PDX2 [Gossypium australe]